MAWCDEAVVTDAVPAQRMTRTWVLRRAFSSGNSWGLTSAAIAATPAERCGAFAVTALHASARLAVGTARAALGLALRSPHHQTRGLRTLARGAGMAVGSVNLAYQESRRGQGEAAGLRRSAPLGAPLPPRPARRVTTSGTNREVRVVVGVLTYQRPDGLSRLLPALVAQAAEVGARIVVVDNDPDGRAEPHVRHWASRGVCYVHEPRPGLAAGRNCALNAARHADVLVFIDDDEVPSSGWLGELVRGWERWRCAAVTGPVRAVFDGQADPWILASGVFERRRLPTGAQVAGAATNNLLLDVAHVRALGLTFDERFGLTGGEDTMFVHDLLRRGGTIRWCDEAEVHEPVRPDRASRRWVLRRMFRAGTTWSRVALSWPADRPAASSNGSS